MKQHEIIQYIRKARGLTQRELSEKINVASSVKKILSQENSYANDIYHCIYYWDCSS